MDINFNKHKKQIYTEDRALAGELGPTKEVAAKCERDMRKSDQIIAKTFMKGRWTFLPLVSRQYSDNYDKIDWSK